MKASNLHRLLSTSAPLSSTNTEVVLLHFGQPRTNYYAKEFVRKRAKLFYNLPDVVSRSLPDSALTNNRVRQCISKYGETTALETYRETLAQNLKGSLSSLLPEFGPFYVSQLNFEEDNCIESLFHSIQGRRSQRMVLLPLYTHFWCGESGRLLSKVAQFVSKSTVPLLQNGKEVENCRVALKSDFSYKVSSIHRWNSHPLVSEYWERQIRKHINEISGVVFAVPRKCGYGREEYDRSVWANCERVMSRLSHCVPWQMGFYNSWDSWNIPQKNSVQSRVKKLQTLTTPEGKIAVVPVTEIFPTFDTIQILPDLASRMNKSVFVSLDEETSLVSQGLAEVIKHHLLGRPHKQLVIPCDHCFIGDCKDRQVIL